MNLSDKDKIRLTLGGMALLGLIAACAAGLLLGWVVWPSAHYNAAPANLQPGHKEEYMILVAAAYAQDHDLEKAEARLEQLDAPNIRQWVAQVADQAIAEGGDEADIRALAALAAGLGVSNPRLARYLPSPTPLPTRTLPASPTLTATPVPPTATRLPPTVTPSPSPTMAPTDTPAPTATLAPTATSTSKPTNTPRPTSPPKPTATPTPTPGPKWTWTARLVGPGEDSQGCDYGNLQIRVLVLNAAGAHMPGVWIYDRYSGQYQVTGNVDSPDYGSGETKFEYGRFGGGSLCVASGEGGPCVSDYTRDMPCFEAPPLDDLYAAGYCNCCEPGITKERCKELMDTKKCGIGFGHYSWRVVFQRNR